ncbi:MAG TPA: hypothetical protein DCQ31_16265 [Bacteroidales bacterium]|nr:hypothetical protein [Bacteroidales bacterium]
MKNLNLFGALAIAFALVVGCIEGPEGPTGLKGEKGDTGAAGVAGAKGDKGDTGAAGEVSCKMCHDGIQHPMAEGTFLLSGHNLNTTEAVSYAGGRGGCARCHSHEGFVEIASASVNSTTTTFAAPSGMKCSTCHDHGNFDFTTNIKGLRWSKAVTPIMYGFTKEAMDIDVSNNLCISCHQGRDNDYKEFATTDYDWTPKFSSSTATGTIRFYPHYVPQAQIFLGKMAYEGFTNPATAFASTTHKGAANCTSCHMGAGIANQTLNHAMKPKAEYCSGCHAGASDLNINGRQTEIDGLEAELATELKRIGILNEAGAIIPARFGTDPNWTVTPGGLFDKTTLTKINHDLAGSVTNYFMVHYDRSKGVHNYKYIKAMLKNSIDYTKTVALKPAK